VKHFSNLLRKTGGYLAIKSSQNYILNSALLDDRTDSIFGHSITTQEEDLDILILVDNQFNYLKHKVIDYTASNIACNELTLLCVDFKRRVYCYDMDLKLVANHQFDIQEIGVEDKLSIEMNDSHLFLLCAKNKVLSIFDLKTFDFVKKIDAQADGIKLVSNSYFILIQLEDKVVHLYNQSGVFEKLDQIELEFDDFAYVNIDKSSTVLFHDELLAKAIHFTDLFNIPMI
jgi:hypothetical protein